MKKFLKYYNNGITILCLAVLGIVVGYAFPTHVAFLKPIGMLFVSLIKMLLMPIIFITVLHAIISIKSEVSIAKLSSFTFSYFFVTTFLAGLVGIGLALLLQPGAGLHSIPKEMLTLTDAMKGQTTVKPVSIWDFVFNVIPTNPFSAMVEGKLLSIMFFTVFFGIALFKVKSPYKKNVVNVVGVFNEALMWMISKIMFLAPIAVFSLMAYMVGTMGFDILALAGKLIGTVVLMDVIWIYLFLAVFVALLSKVSYFSFLKNILPVQVMAFSTSSSLVTLPTNLKACDKMGLNHHSSTFILPLGATMNMNGSSLYYCIVTIFFAQLFGVHLTITDYLLMSLMATFGAMATPGVPGLSLTIIMVLAIANVPIVGLPLIFAIDRILDMPTTTVNVLGDTSCAAIASKLLKHGQ